MLTFAHYNYTSTAEPRSVLKQSFYQIEILYDGAVEKVREP